MTFPVWVEGWNFKDFLGGGGGPRREENFFQVLLAVDKNSLCRAKQEEETCIQVFYMFRLRNTEIKMSLVPIYYPSYMSLGIFMLNYSFLSSNLCTVYVSLLVFCFLGFWHVFIFFNHARSVCVYIYS